MSQSELVRVIRSAGEQEAAQPCLLLLFESKTIST